MKKAFQR